MRNKDVLKVIEFFYEDALNEVHHAEADDRVADFLFSSLKDSVGRTLDFAKGLQAKKTEKFARSAEKLLKIVREEAK